MMAREHYAQVPSGVLNESERGYFVTLSALIEYLKQKSTPIGVTHKAGNEKGKVAYYDQVIDRFFDREAMLREFENDTIVHSVKTRVDVLMQTLHYFDRSLDTLHTSAIVIEPFRFASQANNRDGEVHNALKIRMQKSQVLTFYFDEKTNKIVGIATLYE